MSHYVGDHVAPTVDSSGGGIGHILMTRFSHSRLLPKPAIFRPSPPPFPGVLTSRPPPRIAATAGVVSAFRGIVADSPPGRHGLSSPPRRKQPLCSSSLLFPVRSLQLGAHR